MKKTITEVELRSRVEAGERYQSIAKSIGVHRTALAQACHVLGIKSPYKPGRRITDEMCLSAVQRIAKGERLKEIAPSIGVSYLGLHTALSSRGLPTTAVEFLKRQAASGT